MAYTKEQREKKKQINAEKKLNFDAQDVIDNAFATLDSLKSLYLCCPTANRKNDSKTIKVMGKDIFEMVKADLVSYQFARKELTSLVRAKEPKASAECTEWLDYYLAILGKLSTKVDDRRWDLDQGNL